MKSFGYIILVVAATSAAIPILLDSLVYGEATALASSSHDAGTLVSSSFMMSKTDLILSGIPSVSARSFNSPTPIERASVKGVTDPTAAEPPGRPLIMTKTAIITSTASTPDTATTLITTKGPFRHLFLTTSTTLVASIKTNQVTVITPPTLYETSSDAFGESTHWNDIIFGVFGTVFAFGAVVVGVLAYRYSRKTYNRNRESEFLGDYHLSRADVPLADATPLRWLMHDKILNGD